MIPRSSRARKGEQGAGCNHSTQACCAYAGNFFSAAFEDTCLALVGASGGVFGMVGLFIADMIVNFSYIKRQALAHLLSFLILALPFA